MIRSVLFLFHLAGCLSSNAQEAALGIHQIEDSTPGNIHFSSKSLIKDNKILLQWSTTGINGFYIVERSADSKSFEVIGVIKARIIDINFEFLDEKPLQKRNFYRIKTQAPDEKNLYSDTIAAGVNDSVFCRFYPNPVDKLLILRSDYPALVKICDITGKLRIMQQLKPGLQILDVSCLEKNIYIITIFHEELNQFITKKLIKN